ncbi:SAGA complex subunit spt3 [Wickerhamiella sorbophila]|uniref:SAGA complex subunit spt3 n=1 Tax=Wickerhamiella sorbophila TaxID=45607 RepID=A0A2T0FKV5_9ASCO|nr:SAGA complex subunit spt3 [Wickerhamiella sorbophila]PRT55602.1 SAGA complex subunit spt3 [Wickerhamiella sorbophila]
MLGERYKYRNEIQQMMFVSGATTDPPTATLSLVEDIVRAQVVELVSQGMALARKRGVRAINVEDVMFLLRHDVAKVKRLANYLSWKDLRKNAREQDGNSGGGVDGTDLIEDETEVAAGDAVKKFNKTKKVGMPWKLQNMFSIPAPDDDDDDSDDEDSEANRAIAERLRNADLRTQNMTKEEYVHWSESRQASFTFRKGKRFREWAGISHLTETRLQDDIVDILGFLTFEIVANLTEFALKIKDSSDHPNDEQKRPSKQVYLFDRPNKQQTPLLPRHIREACAAIEAPQPRQTAMTTYYRSGMNYAAKII